MMKEQSFGASSDKVSDWQAIDWPKVRQQVRRLQLRIAKAIRAEKHGKAKALSWLLTHSQSAKLLAVKRVTGNKGAKTPGVDNKLWRTDRQKYAAVQDLNRRGYRPLPLRRHYIPEGTPQGGIVSPVLANLTLDGMEKAIRSRIKIRRDQVNFIRYADDFIVTARTKEPLEQIVKPAVVAFLAERGLELSEQKTTITHIETGFNFLGRVHQTHGGAESRNIDKDTQPDYSGLG